MISSMHGMEKARLKYGSPGFSVYGYDLHIFREDGSECKPGEEGIAAVVPPLLPGCLSTI